MSAQAPTNWRSVGIGGGGALFAPSISPHDPNRMFVSCDMSQVFQTTDMGQSWNTVPFWKLQGGRNAAKFQYTNDPNIIYAIDFTDELQTPVKSTDGGQTWHGLGQDPTFAGCFDIAVDPADPNRVLVCDYSTLYVSTNGGLTFSPKFTNNSGAGMHLGGAFFDGVNIYLGTPVGLVASHNGGGTFAVEPIGGIPTSEQIVSLAGGKANGVTRLFAVTLGAGDVYSGVQGDDHWNYRSMYRYEVGTAGWVRRNGGIPAGVHPFFVAMPRNGNSTLYVAGGTEAGVPIVYKSTNAAASWYPVFKTDNNENIYTGWQGYGGDRGWGYAEFAFGFDVDPVNANYAAITDYGFVHVTSDGGKTWRQTYVKPEFTNGRLKPTPKGKAYTTSGLENTTCWQVGWFKNSTAWANFSDICGIRTTDFGQTWRYGYTGHTLNSSYWVIRHPTTFTMYMATASVHDIYQSTHLTDSSLDGGSGKVLFSNDRGVTWQNLGGLTKPVVNVALDPTNANRLYAAVVNSSTGGIYRCDNIGAGTSATWTKLANPPRTQGHPWTIQVLKDGTLVASYSGRRSGSLFTQSSGVFVSTNGGTSWVDRSAAGMLFWTKDVVIDPHDPAQNTWYAAVCSGWNGTGNGLGGLYRTTNRGQSWTRVLVDDRVESCALNPNNANEMYVTTEFNGLLYSNNRNAGTPTFATVAEYPFKHPLRVHFNPYNPAEIWVTSFGGGIRIGTIGTP